MVEMKAVQMAELRDGEGVEMRAETRAENWVVQKVGGKA